MMRCADCKRSEGMFHALGCPRSGYEEVPERPLTEPPARKPAWLRRSEEQGFIPKAFDYYTEQEAEDGD